MLLEQVKASLEMEDLHLEPAEEKILSDYAEGLISFEEVLSFLKQALENSKAA
ncbi:MAG: hypothetical protein IJ228_13970 [Succinivibrio sp.]|nr:hypothetical protein [Succinivibrio sp.]